MEQKARAKIAHAKDHRVPSHLCNNNHQNTRGPISPSTTKLLKRVGLKYITTDELMIRRRRHGRGFGYFRPDGTAVSTAQKRRLAALAVPPAYEGVLYAADPNAHIQAVGRDAAGRLQYRYHPQWQRVREMRKARRLARLADACRAFSAASVSI